MSLRCWSCGESLVTLSLPLGRRDQCPQCANYLHVCRMCEFFDTSVARACREDDADDVTEKARLNFCDYFKPSADAFDPSGLAAARQSSDQLNALFGDGAADVSTDPADTDVSSAASSQAAESLFRKD